MLNNGQTAGETAIQKFSYDGQPIGFANGESVMVNASQMAKKFGKLPKDWLKLQQTKDLLNALSGRKKILPSDLVQVINGNNGGTWMHEDVALMFAQWLSPDFYIWCNDRIKELARDGVAVMSDDDAVIAHAMQVLQKRLDEKQVLIQAKDEQIEAQEKEIRQLEPLADYTKEVLQGDGTYTFTQVAKSLGFRGVSQFTDWLNGKGVVFRESRSWLPYAKYATLEWFATRTTRYVKSDGTVGTNMYTVITEKGRMGIRQLLVDSQAKAMEGGEL